MIMKVNTKKPILIIGSGISGLLLAQHLRKLNLESAGDDGTSAPPPFPFLIFERDADLATRGLGWGLTLHWSLPAIRALLPGDLISRLPEAYVDRAAVEVERRASAFPFFDLSTGELKASTPRASESDRIRVTRDKFRRLLSTGLDIQWGKAAKSFVSHDDDDDGSVTVNFDDGSSYEGSIIVACDGGSSRIRQQLFPNQKKHTLPVGLMGVKVEYDAEEIEPLRKLDPYFLQGCASANDSFVYFSTLDAPGNYPSKNQTSSGKKKYSTQLAISWPLRRGFFSSPEPIRAPATNEERVRLIKAFASTWADPFRSLALSIPESTTEVKCLELSDWPPPKDLRTKGSVALVGDAMHSMVMYRGEGANHAIVDVLDFAREVLPHVYHGSSAQPPRAALRAALDRYEDGVVARTRPAVLASRQACYDAHQWGRISPQSPLLSRRAMRLEFGEEDMNEPDW